MSRKITKVIQHSRNPHRYHIYVNDEYAFSVHEDVVVDKRLLKGKAVDEAELEAIVKEEEKKKIERAGLRYLSYRPRTQSEMRVYLQQKGFDQALIEEVIVKWVGEGYLNDEAFAVQWIEERLSTKHKGRYLLRQELKEKGIDEQVIRSALSRIDHRAEQEACLKLAQKRMKRYEGLEPTKRKHKLFAYLSQRGYPLHVIETVYEQLMDDEHDF
ncbi:regulatory protein [Caldalkalibacillus uzonensis]|uniref:Regulatory protein RecX n=1 Tax=Caldalkalibacillus uzonensis TaxID=353224 RepID=A0ABU0CMG1_9BACI|nr:RecX family transcriptional regulator [Caldalkalibacillus uzonensis]MDQ0337332.1 regulatory protein [Caldalkalibacillus uzonensis]